MRTINLSCWETSQGGENSRRRQAGVWGAPCTPGCWGNQDLLPGICQGEIGVLLKGVLDVLCEPVQLEMEKREIIATDGAMSLSLTGEGLNLGHGNEGGKSRWTHPPAGSSEGRGILWYLTGISEYQLFCASEPQNPTIPKFSSIWSTSPIPQRAQGASAAAQHPQKQVCERLRLQTLQTQTQRDGFLPC